MPPKSNTTTDTNASNIASLQAQLAAMQAENERLKASQAVPGKLSFKVSEKGAVSIYGMGRFPVTLYASQLARLIEAVPALQEFMKVNSALLAVKENAAKTVSTATF